MNATVQVSEREARAVAEAAREKDWTKPSFVRELFLGRMRLDLLYPAPEPDAGAERRTDEFLERAEAFLRANVDALKIEREGRIPDAVIEGLKELGAFGMKIPEEYGGLGLSQRGYNRAISVIGSYSTPLGVLLSAHQSIGVPQPLKMFGTDEQKRKYLPRLAKGAISAFALTEPDVGSDPARMSAVAVPTEDGAAYVLNGEKLWCTNGPIADVMVVMARTPAKDGKGRGGITAFIVESDWEGVEVVHRCSFMGLRGIENGVIRFTDVRVPRENVLWGEGKGLKLALITLNTGRLTIPATCAASGKWCLKVAREWSSERKQWGAPVGRHDAVAQMIGEMAAQTFAMEAIADLSARLADSGEYDIRLEAAIAKMFNSEAAWRIVDDTMQIRGGRGYETAESLAARGEEAVAVEKMMRDLRINLIFEGSSEIMRLFIAREAVDPHLQHAGAVLDPDAPLGAKAKDAAGLGMHMAGWVAGNLVGWGHWPRYGEFGRLARHLRYGDRAARKLARTLAFQMARLGPKLEKRQSILFRLVDIGAEIFAIAAVCIRAQELHRANPGDDGPLVMADLFCRGARRRIAEHFRAVARNDDVFRYRVAQEVLAGEHAWLESGVVDGAGVAPSGAPPAEVLEVSA
ncbi:MAG TPA: acyl-CoA dehydrogenase family protein [Longimicrobiales bacterium]